MAFSGPFNINDQSNLYGSKRRNLNADLHHNKNHEIFSDGYSALDQRVKQYEPGNHGIRLAAVNGTVPHSNTENDSQGQSFNRSPSLRKSDNLIGKTKPNHMDPS